MTGATDPVAFVRAPTAQFAVEGDGVADESTLGLSDPHAHAVVVLW